ncbi:MAG: DUF362 domain-containing protein, partial [Anaerolineae bacterium]
MAHCGISRPAARSGITRRRFLQLAGAGVTWLAAGQRRACAARYPVGLSHLADPYAATLAAVNHVEWPAAAVAGRRVVIKPNLVVPMTADTGVTTDPEVVRALVDLALGSGATKVSIVEGGLDGAHFSDCGYDFF